jgi:DNA-binding beta-propeller fold protein YncE
MKRVVGIISCFILAGSLFYSCNNEGFTYKIVNRIQVEGDGGWDYIAMDEPTGRLFISHSMVTQVVDSRTGELIGTIEDTKGVHGIAIDHEDNKAFISCGRDSSVTIVNLGTLEQIAKVKVTGANPDAILYDKFSGRVFAYNGRTANATVIDAVSDTVVATIPLAGKPEFSVSDGKGKVYVNIEDKGLLTVIDSKNLTVENVWSLAPGEEPTGLSLDNTNHLLFSVCSNKLMVIMSAIDGTIIDTVAIGEGSDGCAFDPGLKRAYSSNGEGTLSVIQVKENNTFELLGTLATNRSARTICVDTKTHHVYLPYAEYEPAPEATEDNPHPRPKMKPGTFAILDIAPF